jgi:hypothetical protein
MAAAGGGSEPAGGRCNGAEALTPTDRPGRLRRACGPLRAGTRSAKGGGRFWAVAWRAETLVKKRGMDCVWERVSWLGLMVCLLGGPVSRVVRAYCPSLQGSHIRRLRGGVLAGWARGTHSLACA